MSFKIREELAYRRFADQMVIVAPEGGVLHTLNEVGCFAWQQIEAGNDTLEGLVAELTRQFEVDPQQATGDLQKFLDEMTAKRLLQDI